MSLEAEVKIVCDEPYDPRHELKRCGNLRLFYTSTVTEAVSKALELGWRFDGATTICPFHVEKPSEYHLAQIAKEAGQ